MDPQIASLAVEAAQVVHGSTDYLRLARRAKWLSWVSLGYMAVEGAVAIVAGIVAGSIADIDRVRTVSAAGAWGYTIGSAVFDGLLPGAPSVADQVRGVLESTAQSPADTSGDRT